MDVVILSLLPPLAFVAVDIDIEDVVGDFVVVIVTPPDATATPSLPNDPRIMEPPSVVLVELPPIMEIEPPFALDDPALT